MPQPGRGLCVGDRQRHKAGADTLRGELGKRDVAHAAILSFTRIGVHDTPRSRGGVLERETQVSPFARRIFAAKYPGLEPASLAGGDRYAGMSRHQRMDPDRVAIRSGQRLRGGQPVAIGLGGS